MTGVRLALIASLVALGFAYVAAADADAASAAVPQLAYTSLATPQRICDTRPMSQSGVSDGCTGETLAAGSTLTLPVTALPTAAVAVEVNVAATNTAGQGFFTIFPTGGSTPGTSNLDFTKGQTASNLVTVALGTDASDGNAAAISIFNGPSGGTGGRADAVVDLEGYWAPPSGAAGQYFALSASRIADSRCGRTPNGTGSDCAAEDVPSANAKFDQLGAGVTESIQAAGVGGIPSSGVSAVVLGVTVTNATASSYVSTFTGGGSPGMFSNVDFAAGQTIASKVIVPVTSSGAVSFFNHAGDVDVIVDAEGYFSSSSSTSTGSLFTPLSSPARVIPQTTVDAGSATSATITGSNGVPSNATAGVFDLTDVSPADGNFLTGFPAGTATPSVSDVDWVPEDPYNVVADAAFGTLGSSGSYSVLNGPADTKNNAGPAGVIADLFGYFSPALSPPSQTVSLTATPESLPADGSFASVVVATVTASSSGTEVSGATVNFSTSGTCGSLSATSATTNSSGQASVDYTSATIVGSCTITGTVAQTGASGDVSIAQVVPANLAVTVTATPSSIIANGTSTSTINATLSASGNSVPGDLVTFAATGTPPAACSALSASATSGILTNAAGQASFTYVSSTTSGFCTVTATEHLAGFSGGAIVTQNQA